MEGYRLQDFPSLGTFKASEMLLSVLNSLDHSREVPVKPPDLFQECQEKEVRKSHFDTLEAKFTVYRRLNPHSFHLRYIH